MLHVRPFSFDSAVANRRRRVSDACCLAADYPFIHYHTGATAWWRGAARRRSRVTEALDTAKLKIVGYGRSVDSYYVKRNKKKLFFSCPLESTSARSKQ